MDKLRKVSVRSVEVRLPAMATSLTNRLKVAFVVESLCSTSMRRKFPQSPGFCAGAPRIRRPAKKFRMTAPEKLVSVPFAADVSAVIGAPRGPV